MHLSPLCLEETSKSFHKYRLNDLHKAATGRHKSSLQSGWQREWGHDLVQAASLQESACLQYVLMCLHLPAVPVPREIIFPHYRTKKKNKMSSFDETPQGIVQDLCSEKKSAG